MSKASKKSAKKARKTIIAGLRSEVNNYQALSQQFERERDEARAEVKKVTAQADQNSTDCRLQTERTMRLRESVNRLKVTVAGIERELAEARGIISVYEKQADQSAAPVMVKPAVMLSPLEAKRYNNGLRVSLDEQNASALKEGWTGTQSSQKHWTAE